MSAKTYTVTDHIDAMREAGAHYVWYNDGIWQNMHDCDDEAFLAAREKARFHNITASDVYEAMRPNTELSNAGCADAQD